MTIPNSLRDLFSRFKRPKLYMVPNIVFDLYYKCAELVAKDHSPTFDLVFESNRKDIPPRRTIAVKVIKYEYMLPESYATRSPLIIELGDGRYILLNPPSVVARPYYDEHIHLSVYHNEVKISSMWAREI